MTHDPSDRQCSDRQWLAAYADRLLAAARAYASPGNARITFPGPEGGYGRAVDGLEGFVRTFLLASFRIAGDSQPVDGTLVRADDKTRLLPSPTTSPDHESILASGRPGLLESTASAQSPDVLEDLIDFYRTGIIQGVDPKAEDRWVRLDEHPQAKVEAASIAIALDLTRPRIWDTLPRITQSQLIDYLAPVVNDDTYPRNNWLWFRVAVQTFLRSVDGPWSLDDIKADLALHESFQRGSGWASDGDERAYDHYLGWALHVYPVLWPRMTGAEDLVGDLREVEKARLDAYLSDALAMIGSDGAPLFQGRSLIYRFAAAAPFWAGILADVPSHKPGTLRQAATEIVRHFAKHDVPNEDGVLTMGWHGEWRQLAQSYSGPGSPYWASKGLLGLALPADHPCWTDSPDPLPVTRDVLRIAAAPAWVISGTASDGIVRVINHGADRAMPGTLVGDSPLYARLGYSTATTPLLDEQAWTDPLEQSVTILDQDGRTTHRAALTPYLSHLDTEQATATAGSESTAHWLTPDPEQQRHGSGLVGTVEPAGLLTVCSFVRGPWEVRLARVNALAPNLNPADLRLRFGGWPVMADDLGGTNSNPVIVPAPIAGQTSSSPGLCPTPDSSPCAQDDGSVGVQAIGRGLTSRLVPLTGTADAEVVSRPDASPLGGVSSVPTLTFPLATGVWTGVLVELTGVPRPSETAPRLVLDEPARATVTWPDGRTTSHRLDHQPPVTSPASPETSAPLTPPDQPTQPGPRANTKGENQ